MRIIGGKYKGRIFRAGKSFKARPTTDFARENLFNILTHRIDFEGMKILDLFGGTGSITFEFVSRGCDQVTCVEKEFKHYQFINSTMRELGAEGEIRLLRGDVFKYLDKAKEKFDLIFADPPFDLKNLAEIPDIILKNGLLEEGGQLILEHGRTNSFENHPNFEEMRTYGSVHFSFFNA